MKITIDRSLLENVTETLEGMVNANWRNWEELSSPEEFERWVKSRANFLALALRESLAQPQQEPVAWMHGWHDGEDIPLLHPYYNDPPDLDPPESVRPLVFGDTAPPERNPLTDDQWQAVSRKARDAFFGCKQDSVLGQIDCAAHAAMRATEATHGIKDTPC